MKILVIGGSGILSSAVVDCCLDKGYEVTMMNRGNNSTYMNPNAKVIICDARNEEMVQSKTKGLHFDVVVDFIVYTKEQLERSLNLFGRIADQYIFISSAQVYNTSLKKILVETDETPQSLWSYSVNKDICEKYLQTYCQEQHVNYTIIRPGVNYDNRRIPYGMYPPIGTHWTIVARILSGKPIITWNKGQNRLNLTRVEDFAKGVVGLLGNKRAYNESFNVCGDYVYSWQQVLDVLGQNIGKSVKTIDVPLEYYAKELNSKDQEMLLGGRACDLVLSNTKLKKVFPDYSSSIELNEGIRRTLEWYKQNEYYYGFDYAWDAEQDRIINKYGIKKNKMSFVNYSNTDRVTTLGNLCTYKIEYNKGRKCNILLWKLIRRTIYKPLKRILQ